MDIKQISDAWQRYEHGDGEKLNSRWLAKSRIDMGALFGVDIEMRRPGKGEADYTLVNPEILENNELFGWCMSALPMNESIHKAMGLNDRIILKGYPSENGNLNPLIDAMRINVRVRIEYQKYDSPDKAVWTLEPYCMMQYGCSLYFLGRTYRGKLLTWALDRITSMKLTKSTFELPRNFDAHDYFRDAYGIYVDYEEFPPQKVILRAYDKEPYYMISKQIHSSQKIINHMDDYTDFEYFISCSWDFIGYILSRGDRVQVLYPQSLIDEVLQRLNSTTERYKEPNKKV